MFGEKQEVKVAVAVPAFNEVMTAEVTIKPLLELQNVSQVVFVDTKSNDGTVTLLNKIVLKRNGEISIRLLRIYDRCFLPTNFFLHKLFGGLSGKNIFVVARKAD